VTNENWWLAHKVDLPEGQVGRWAIERFTVREGVRLQPYYLVYGRDCPPGTYTGLVRYEDGSPEIGETMDGATYLGGHEVMTDLPGEIEDHADVMEAIRTRGGRILIHGLGLGLIVKFALAQPNVTRVDVVELNQDVIDLVAHHYDRDERLQIHYGNAFTYEWPDDAHWTVAWHDIWDNYLLVNLGEMEFLRQRFAGRADWQGFWSRDYLLTVNERKHSRERTR
jgi:hypothetical protein